MNYNTIPGRKLINLLREVEAQGRKPKVKESIWTKIAKTIGTILGSWSML